MTQAGKGWWLSAWASALLLLAGPGGGLAQAKVIGLDAVHGWNPLFNLSTGPNFASFRSEIVAKGHTIVPLSTFDAASLSAVDAVFFLSNYSQNARPYTAAEGNAIRAFASGRQVFLSDASLWDQSADSDTPIAYGDNRLLLDNILAYVSTAGHSTVFLADTGTGADTSNFNTLVAPYGIVYATTPTDGAPPRDVSGFVPHPVTAGLIHVGVDYQLPMTITSPGIDLTIGAGQDNIVAVGPEPGTSPVLAAALLTRFAQRRRVRGL
jgi:hypothetical protein